MRRISLVSAALRFLKGQETIQGRVPFASAKQAAEVLKGYTGQDFGTDAVRWGAWLNQNRKAVMYGPVDAALLAPALYFHRHGTFPPPELTGRKRRPTKPANWKQAPLRALLELLQRDRANDPRIQPPQKIRPPDPFGKGVPTLQKNVYRKPTPMVDERFRFAGQWRGVDPCGTWLSLPEMEQVWTNRRMQKHIRTLREHWDESAPHQFPAERLSLLALSRSQGDQVYLVWPKNQAAEPEVWCYFGQSQTVYRNFREYVKWMLS
jgi:hypothetical protein